MRAREQVGEYNKRRDGKKIQEMELVISFYSDTIEIVSRELCLRMD